VNEKGHLFQFALLKHVRTLHASEKSRWIDEVGEWPLVLRDKETQIDLIVNRSLHVSGWS